MTKPIQSKHKDHDQIGMDFSSKQLPPGALEVSNYKGRKLNKYADISAYLPDPIRPLCDCQSSENEKMLVAISSLVAISGLTTRVHGVYKGEIIYTNLFFIALAGAGSGKSSVAKCRRLLKKIHQEILKSSRQLKVKYDQDMALYQKAIKKGSSLPLPEKPKLPVVLLSGDITPERLVEHIYEADGSTPLIMIEEEIDTLEGSKKSYGDLSPILRKSASGEPISYSRKGNDQYIDSYAPKLVLILTGTPEQILGLIKNAVDGLYSRSLFYFYEAAVEWQSVAPNPSKIDSNKLYQDADEEIYKLYHFLKGCDLEIRLTDGQWKSLDQFGEFQLHHLFNFHGKESAALAKRHCVMIFKLCMTLTAIRKFINQDPAAVLLCSDADFELALSLVEISLASSLKVIRMLPQATPAISIDKKMEFYNTLPSKFTHQEFVDIAQKLSIPTRTAERGVHGLCHSKYLDKQSHNNYIKQIAVAEVAEVANS